MITCFFVIYFRSDNEDEMGQTVSNNKVLANDSCVQPHKFASGFLDSRSTSRQSGERAQSTTGTHITGFGSTAGSR